MPKARKLDKITYEEMLELASVGAKVLQTRSVELAMNERVRVQVLSSFADAARALWWWTRTRSWKSRIVTGIAYSPRRGEDHVAAGAGPARHRRGDLRRARRRTTINVDMIVQNISADGTTDMTFTVEQGRPAARAGDAGGAHSRRSAMPRLLADPNVAKISVVGVGMRSHAGVANTMFRALADKAINIQVISTSEIKVSVLVAAEYTELAVRALHTAYGLDAG